VTYPVNFISTFFVSGLTKNICNIWSQSNISSGDDLIFRLEKLPIAARDGSIKYHLNHWKKSMVVQQFKYEDGGVNEAWQLVPAVWSTYTPPRVVEGYDYREHGYWHICRSQVMFRNETGRGHEAPCSALYHDDRASMRGALVEATFEPVWVEYTPWAPSRGAKRSATEAARPVARFGWSQALGDEGRGGAGREDGGGGEGPARAQGFLGAPMPAREEPMQLDAAAPSDPAPAPAAAAPKKPRRTLGLAVGLGKEASVMVQSVGKVD
jgi:hypothetical protein